MDLATRPEVEGFRDQGFIHQQAWESGAKWETINTLRVCSHIFRLLIQVCSSPPHWCQNRCHVKTIKVLNSLLSGYSATLAIRGGRTVRVGSSALGTTFLWFFLKFLCHCLWAPDNTKYVVATHVWLLSWTLIMKKWAIQQPVALTSYEHLGVRLYYAGPLFRILGCN